MKIKRETMRPLALTCHFVWLRSCCNSYSVKQSLSLHAEIRAAGMTGCLIKYVQIMQEQIIWAVQIKT